MASLKINRLILEVDGWNEQETKELAMQVIDRLASGAGSGYGSNSTSRIQVEVTAPDESGKGRLAADLADRILDQVRAGG